jgi:hypothetical protein
MKKTIVFISSFLLLISVFSSAQDKIGISRLYSDLIKTDPVFHAKIEDILLSSLSTSGIEKKYALNLRKSAREIDEFFSQWKKNDATVDRKFAVENIAVIGELKDLDVLICPEIESFKFYEEKDFYDTNIINYKMDLNFKISVFDVKKKVMEDENSFEINQTSRKSLEETKTQSVYYITKKIDSYFTEISNLNQKIGPLSTGKLFIRLNKGKDIGLKPGNILVYSVTDAYIKSEHTVVQVIKVDDNECLADIIYTKGDIPEDANFVKQSKINMELQFGGGFVISQPQNHTPFLYGDADIRVLIPVGIIFFNPVIHFEFNFFYLAQLENSSVVGPQGRLFMPFTLETGIQGKYNIHRFEFAGGFLVGILFSPDANNNYRLDSPVLRPYLHLAVLINTGFNLFAEFGYRYYVNDGFSIDWKTDLKGMYFTFGFGVDL